MPFITLELLRKRAEHNAGMVSTLEEISLHQEELESINEVLGTTCRQLKILYLQNNIISKMENLHHMKKLEYLNLALNNISKIEGLQNCEFLYKLDLTANFIDFDSLEESIANLIPLDRLSILYMMGNPSQVNWPPINADAGQSVTGNEKFNAYVVAKLPQLKSLDGTEITKSMQIIATQKVKELEAELKLLAQVRRLEKLNKQKSISSSSGNNIDEINGEVSISTVDPSEDIDIDNELTENTPETRVKIYRELAEQKKEKSDRDKANEPKKRDYDREHQQSLNEIRHKEHMISDTEIKQKNEGNWDFKWDEDTKPGHLILDIQISSYLDSSLIDVDIHPTYISILIKSKLLRLRLPSEVKVNESKCQRSKVTGSLIVIMPKINPKEITLIAHKTVHSNSSSANKNNPKTNIKLTAEHSSAPTSRVKKFEKKLSVQEMLQQECLTNNPTAISVSSNTSANNNHKSESTDTINLNNIVKVRSEDLSKDLSKLEITESNPHTSNNGTNNSYPSNIFNIIEKNRESVGEDSNIITQSNKSKSNNHMKLMISEID